MAPAQHHPFYVQEKAAFEQDPANAVLLALGKDNEGLAGLARDVIRDAPDPTPPRFDGIGWSHVGDPADDWMAGAARTVSTGDAGFFQIVTKAGYFYSGFYTPGGWCTKFWSDDDPPKNMTFGNLSLGSRPLKAASEAIRQQVDEELEEVTGHVKQWACTTLFPTPSVLQYVRGKEASARC
ncbi:hypothetical protein AAT19DRAFT_8690 [Rhodotorula toruloides]|uniref:Uncharacterized protein n=1 Tax=Rhodotorula toruloides TaxID=5286 RepID=A0A2T0AI05_RHOTO|nr:hypothetical protein AAT19DRAFT_8690 [Rhodotorula toruloides]